MSRLTGLIVLVGVVAACGSPPLTVAEFCDLARRADAATVRLVQLPRGTAEFDDQLELVRGINDRMFSNAPEEIADVAEELGPLLTNPAADNDRVNVLLDQVAAYVTQKCPTQ